MNPTHELHYKYCFVLMLQSTSTVSTTSIFWLTFGTSFLTFLLPLSSNDCSIYFAPSGGVALASMNEQADTRLVLKG